MNNIKHKTALITGATSGIGKACAISLAKKKTNLILVSRREEKLKKLQKKLQKFNINIDIIGLDVKNKIKVFEKISKISKKRKIDILINNAGLALGIEPIDQGKVENWDDMIDTNIKGLLYISKVILPKMREQNSGHIINIGSIAGETTYPGGNVYCATKSAVHSISEAMNIDLWDTNVKISSIAPGAVRTEFSDVRFKGNKKKANLVYEGFKALKAKDIAKLITYVLNAPLHVNIQHSIITPTAQRNPYILRREKS